jgi:RNA-directed DNA polymerase
LHSTFNGVPQGGIISPTLLVIALSGLEEAIKKVTSRKDKVNLVFYADDFIVTGATKEVLEHKIMPLVVSFLKERGLELSTEKTRITHIDDGFDFLGFNLRKYRGKLLIKPSKKNVLAFLREIRKLIKLHATASTEVLIRQLNLRLRGWANYYRHAVAKDTFTYVDDCIYRKLLRWMRRRHPMKSAKWRSQRYFRTEGGRQWIFSVAVSNKEGKRIFLDLLKATHIPIRRHIKIKSEATPYDPQYDAYFLKRKHMQKSVENEKTAFCQDLMFPLAFTGQPGRKTAFERLERSAVKAARSVLKGENSSNAASLT